MKKLLLVSLLLASLSFAEETKGIGCGVSYGVD